MPATRKEIAAARSLSELKALAEKHEYSWGWHNRIYYGRLKKQKYEREAKIREALELAKRI